MDRRRRPALRLAAWAALAVAICPAVVLGVPAAARAAGGCEATGRFALAIHGGTVDAGGHHPRMLDFVRAQLEVGRAVLENGGTAVDTVEAVIAAMEDSGLFNAGRGSTANLAGDIETDAAIMDGAGHRAGAIAAAKRVRNPIRAAALVMRKSGHVLMVGPDGEAFVHGLGAESVEPSYFPHSGESFADLDLPADLATVAPPPDLPEAKARFAGAWSGALGGALNHVLVAERIDADGADVLVAYGANEGAGIVEAETVRVRADFRGKRLSARTPRADFGYWFGPDGTLHARIGLTGGPSILGTLHRNEDPAGLRRHGTVGAVALDRCGHLAAGTSTGGYGSKTPGRVGDSPIVGAGTYADDHTAALSATGHGEYFMR